MLKNGGGVKVKEKLKSNQAITLIALVITLDTIGIIAQMEIWVIMQAQHQEISEQEKRTRKQCSKRLSTFWVYLNLWVSIAKRTFIWYNMYVYKSESGRRENKEDKGEIEKWYHI